MVPGKIIIQLAFGVLLTSSWINCLSQPPSNSKIDKAFSKIENRIIDTIFKLPEVKRRIAYVQNQSHNMRHVQVGISSTPTKEQPYYILEVKEDNGMAMHIHFNFYVYPKGLLIKYLDTGNNDNILTLEQWRKSPEHPKE